MKDKLYVITLEPIEKRYTKQWYKFWKEEFSKYYQVFYIDGYPEGVKFSDKIESGRFLDINMTNVWKAEQVKKAALLFNKKKIKEGDTFIFMDAWHFGITAIRYMAQLAGIKIKMFGYWHAGTYDHADFVAQAGLGWWAAHNELAWFKALDGNFVATQFHKQLILETFQDCNIKQRVHVVGFPLDWKKYIFNELGKGWRLPAKENLVVFPHRLDKEKCPQVFDSIAKVLPQYVFTKTLDVTKSKKEYYQLLAKSKVVFSASKQETFGIGTVEAMMLGAIPIVPNTLSYVELYDDQFKYSDINTARRKIQYVMNHYKDSKRLMVKLRNNKAKIQRLSTEAIPNMVQIMRRKDGR